MKALVEHNTMPRASVLQAAVRWRRDHGFPLVQVQAQVLPVEPDLMGEAAFLPRRPFLRTCRPPTLLSFCYHSSPLNTFVTKPEGT